MRFGGGESSKNETNYLDVVQPENDGTCPKGYRQCGSNEQSNKTEDKMMTICIKMQKDD